VIGELVIGELGTTTDPLRLVPGSAHALRADARALADQAGRLEDAAADVAHRVISSWTGTAADGWAQRRGILDESLRAVGQVHRTAGTVLTAHAQVLQWAQQRAALAVDLWQVGEQKDATSALACTPTTPRLGVRTGSVNVFGQSGGLYLAPGAAWRAQAQQVLAGARLQVSASASAAARVLDAMDEGLPDGQFHFDQFLYGIGDWVAGIGELGWRFSNIRAYVDHDAWWADVRDTGTGLWDTATYLGDNPDQTIPVLLNTQAMHDNPGRWWGNLFPDIALTLAGGAGLATKLASGLRLGEGLTDLLATRRAAFLLADPEAGMIDLAAFLRREPINLTGGTTLTTVSGTEEAAVAARVEALREGRVLVGPLVSPSEADSGWRRAVAGGGVMGPRRLKHREPEAAATGSYGRTRRRSSARRGPALQHARSSSSRR